MSESSYLVPTKPRFPKRAAAAVSVLLAALFCAAALAQSPVTLKEGTVYNRAVYFIANDKLEISLVKQGGSMLRLQIQGDPVGLSPYGNPEMVPSVPDNRKLTGTMVGHFVCVDGFGNPSPQERAAGFQMHGEAYLQPWKLASSEKQGNTQTVKFSIDLPLAQEGFTRTLRMVDGESVVYVNSELENRVAFDRTANWGEHPFLFPPFMEPEKMAVDMSGTRAKTRTGGQRLPFAQGLDFTLAAGSRSGWKARRHTHSALRRELAGAHHHAHGPFAATGLDHHAEHGQELPAGIPVPARGLSVGAELHAVQHHRMVGPRD